MGYYGVKRQSSGYWGNFVMFEGEMVTRSGERHRGCGVIGASLRAARDGYKVRRVSSGLRGNRGIFDHGAQYDYKVANFLVFLPML